MKSSSLAISCLACALISASPAAAACTLDKVAEMPLTELGAHYAVMAQIGDATRPMIVDTGAGLTALKSSVASDLKLPQDSSLENVHNVVGIGQTKSEAYLNVIPSVLGFGDLVYRDRSTGVMKMDDGTSPEAASAGLLGDDILSKFDVEFDFPSKKLTFYRALDCYASFVPWTGTHVSTPFVHRGNKIVIDAIFNEERTRAIVDTGAALSFISRRSLALWGVPDAQLIDTSAAIGTGLNGGSSFALKTYLFDKVTIGDEVFRARLMGIADIDLIFGSALLGLDYWKTHKIWISYPNERIFIANPKSLTTVAYPVTSKPPTQPAAAAARPSAGATTPSHGAAPALVAALGSEAAIHRNVAKDAPTWLLNVYSLGEDCQWEMPPAVSILKAPEHGTASIEVRDRHPEYPPNSSLEKCNALKTPMIVIEYAPAAGYVGEDTVTIDEVYADGRHHAQQVDVTVD